MNKIPVPIEIILACLKRGELLSGEKVNNIEWHQGETTLRIISGIWKCDNTGIFKERSLFVMGKAETSDASLELLLGRPVTSQQMTIYPPAVIIYPELTQRGIRNRIIAVEEKKEIPPPQKRKKVIPGEKREAQPISIPINWPPTDVEAWNIWYLGEFLKKSEFDGEDFGKHLVKCLEAILKKTSELLKDKKVSIQKIKRDFEVEFLPVLPKKMTLRKFLLQLKETMRLALLEYK